MVQSNLSRTRAGGLRGLHFHRAQADYWCVLEGSAFVALIDLRAGSPTQDALWWETFDAEAGLRGLYVPAGVAHGFLALEPLELLYLVTNEFDGSDELGFAWDDPAVGVPWPEVPGTPDGRPILSDRDRSNPTLAELVDRLRG